MGTVFKDLGIDPRDMAQIKSSANEGFTHKYVKGMGVENLLNTINTFKTSKENILGDVLKASEFKYYQEFHVGERDAIDTGKIVDALETINRGVNVLEQKNPKAAMSVREGVADSFIAGIIKNHYISSDPGLKTLAQKNNAATKIQDIIDGSKLKTERVRERVQRRMEIRAAQLSDRGIVDDITMSAHMGKSVLNLTKSAALGAGIMYFVDKLRKTGNDKEAEMEGLSHNSLMTVIRRRQLSDFISKLGFLNLISKNTFLNYKKISIIFGILHHYCRTFYIVNSAGFCNIVSGHLILLKCDTSKIFRFY